MARSTAYCAFAFFLSQASKCCKIEFLAFLELRGCNAGASCLLDDLKQQDFSNGIVAVVQVLEDMAERPAKGPKRRLL